MSAVNELKQIPFQHLIGAPLKAAIESQALAAKTTVDFIKEVGFISNENTLPDPFSSNEDAAVGTVRNVTFKYTKKDENETDKDFTLTVPILTITPIPYIRIEEMTIDFKAKLTDMVTTSSSSAAAVDTTLKGSYGQFWTPVSASFRVSASYKTNTTRNSAQTREYQMDIHVRAVQDEMPTGLSRIIDILEGAISDKKD